MFKKVLKFIFILSLTIMPVQAGRGGSAFAGGLVGSVFGSVLGSAINRPRARTVVVKEEVPAVTKVTAVTTVSKSDLDNVENKLTDMMYRLENAFKVDLRKLYSKIDTLEQENDNLKSKVVALESEVRLLRQFMVNPYK